MLKAKIQVIVGGQFGSEAKGHIAGYLAAQEPTPFCVRVAGGNAGHSAVHPGTGVKYALRQIPVGAVTNPAATLGIAAGSEIELDVLRQEVELLETDGIEVRSRLVIDPAATVLAGVHQAIESERNLTGRLGSTSKGIGAARAARIMRDAETVRDRKPEFAEFGRIGGVASEIDDFLGAGLAVQIEGTQGYGLGLHTSFYPFVTSSDCTATDFLAMAKVNPWKFNLHPEVWVVYRPYPIRVAGNSGPLTNETAWEALGLEPEYTTVTRKMRRVGHWDPVLAVRALYANGGPSDHVHVALTMADQIDPALAGMVEGTKLLSSERFVEFADRVVKTLKSPIELVTTSDRTCIDLREAR